MTKGSMDADEIEKPLEGARVATPRLASSQPSSALGLLADIAQMLVSVNSPERVLESIADALRQLVPHDTLTIYAARPRSRLLEPVIVRDRYAEELLALGPLAYGTGVTGWVAEHEEPQLVREILDDSRSEHIAGTPDEPESLIAVPLVAATELKGVLCLYRLGEGNIFTEEEFGLAIRFGALAALAIDNAEIRSRLAHEAVTDHSTGLYNHRYFHERLAEEVSRANRRRSMVSLVVFDIDDFKWVNDTHGHLVGDRVLQSLASIARETVRAEDPISRIGGEEFAIVLPGQGGGEAAALAERLRLAMSRFPFLLDIRVTMSAGVAEAPLHASGPRELFAAADQALFQAKAAGKNRVRVFQRGESMPSIEDVSGHARGDQGLDLPDEEQRWRTQMRLLHGLSVRLSRAHDVRAVAEAITAELKGLIDYHTCAVYELDPNGQTLRPLAFRDALSDGAGETRDAPVGKVGGGSIGRAVQLGQTINVPDVGAEEGRPASVEAVEESLLAVPISPGDGPLGVIAVSKLGLRQFDGVDERLMETLAAIAAIAFQHARLLEEREPVETV